MFLFGVMATHGDGTVIDDAWSGPRRVLPLAPIGIWSIACLLFGANVMRLTISSALYGHGFPVADGLCPGQQRPA